MHMFKYVLCEDGFENRIEDGMPTGFNVRMRIPYYRGIPLSMVEDILIKVDGASYTGGDILFEVHDGTFTLEEMSTVVRHRWNYGEKAIVKVIKPGGLVSGKHHVEAYVKLRISYLPIQGFAGGYADLSIS
jgi:hypothetical protein